MSADHCTEESIDWSLTTWEGASREQMRRLADLTLTEIVSALEEMQAIAEWLDRASVAPFSPVEKT